MDATSAGRLRRLLCEGINWTSVYQTSLRHGVTPLLYQSLNTICPDAVPKTVMEQLREHFRGNALRNFLLFEELLTVVKLFEAHGVGAIPYKGPTLALSVYGNLLLRQFDDLDILVPKRDYERAHKLLIAHGYILKKEFDWESAFLVPSGMVAIDLHKEMTAPDFPFPLNFERVSARLQRVDLGGRQVTTLCPEDTLLMLAGQITKDFGSLYFQLAKICDIAELLRVCPRLDLTQAMNQARKLGVERMLLFSLRLADNLLCTLIPQGIILEYAFEPALEALVDKARNELSHGADRIVRDQSTIVQFRWLVRERFRDKLSPYYVRYVRDFLTPCEIDRCLFRLPSQLSFLYYFIRLTRLLAKYGFACAIGASKWASVLGRRLSGVRQMRAKTAR